jgi:hypothetical protein
MFLAYSTRTPRSRFTCKVFPVFMWVSFVPQDPSSPLPPSEPIRSLVGSKRGTPGICAFRSGGALGRGLPRGGDAEDML